MNENSFRIDLSEVPSYKSAELVEAIADVCRQLNCMASVSMWCESECFEITHEGVVTRHGEVTEVNPRADRSIGFVQMVLSESNLFGDLTPRLQR
jgi:hypothetical protein